MNGEKRFLLTALKELVRAVMIGAGVALLCIGFLIPVEAALIVSKESSGLLRDEAGDSADHLFYGEVSDNFIMRWAFQDFCDHVYDPRMCQYRWPTDRDKGVTFDPAAVEPGDVIFVRCFDKFFREMHPRIEHPYIIVSHGECLEAIQKEHLAYMDEEKVIAWFGIHAYEERHSKFTPIPIGVLQEPAHYKKRKQMDQFFTELRRTTKKDHLVYMNFAAQDEKPERQMLRKKFIDEPYCKRGARQPFKDYMKEMASCMFAFSPPGLGCDCYRTWEVFCWMHPDREEFAVE